MNDNMTSFSANADDDQRLVVFVTYPDFVLLDLVGPLQVFSHALNPATGRQGYTCAVTSLPGGMVATNTVVATPTEPMAGVVYGAAAGSASRLCRNATRPS